MKAIADKKAGLPQGKFFARHADSAKKIPSELSHQALNVLIEPVEISNRIVFCGFDRLNHR